MKQIDTAMFDVSGVLLNDIYTVWKADSDAYEACGLGNPREVQRYIQPSSSQT